MTNEERSSRMLKTIVAAESLGNHTFNTGGQDRTLGVESPKLSPAGQFYMSCVRCARSVFEDGSGSAASSLHCI